MISVIVPIYNSEKLLAKCIDSLLAQSYSDFELVLVDDGSTDRSGIFCDDYCERDKRIKVIHQENLGVSEARNHGLDVARGEYVCFVDSDDYVTEDYLSNFTFGVDLSVQGYMVSNRGDIIKRSYKNTYSENDAARIYCTSQLHSGPICKLCRTSIIKKYNVRFPKGISFSEDTIFFLRYLQYCDSISITDKVGYVYVNREGTLSNKRHPIDELMRKEEYIFPLYEGLFEAGRFKRRFMREMTLNVVSKYYYNEGKSFKWREQPVLCHVAGKYLSGVDKIILSLNYPLFAKYVRWRRRFKKYVLKRLLHKDTILC